MALEIPDGSDTFIDGNYENLPAGDATFDTARKNPAEIVVIF